MFNYIQAVNCDDCRMLCANSHRYDPHGEGCAQCNSCVQDLCCHCSWCGGRGDPDVNTSVNGECCNAQCSSTLCNAGQPVCCNDDGSQRTIAACVKRSA